MQTPPVIELRNVSFAYGADTVLSNVSLTVSRGDFLAVIGPNGGGKSTLLKLMLGRLRPGAGTVRLFEEEPSRMTRRTGYVPQNTAAGQDFPITAIDVVLMGRLGFPKRFSRNTPADFAAARRALEIVEMWDFRGRKIGELSGGQRQRIYLARALAAEPEVLLLDEPTANIDASGERRVYEVLKTLNDHLTIVVVSHDLTILLGYAKSLAHVNTTLHHHPEPVLAPESLALIAGLSAPRTCPVELLRKNDLGRQNHGAFRDA